LLAFGWLPALAACCWIFVVWLACWLWLAARSGCLLLDVGCWLLDAGCWLLLLGAAGC